MKRQLYARNPFQKTVLILKFLRKGRVLVAHVDGGQMYICEASDLTLLHDPVE